MGRHRYEVSAKLRFWDEAGFSINMRSPNARSIRGTPAIVETPTSRALSHTILGAISANDVLTIEIREPMRPKKVKVDVRKKRKKPAAKKNCYWPLHEVRF